jgi:hypothetical protein
VSALEALARLQAAQKEFDRVAGETLAMLAEYRERSLERERQMSAVTTEAIAACDRVLEQVRA